MERPTPTPREGLLDINRNTRAFHDRFAEINNDHVIVPQIDRHAIWSGDSIALKPEGRDRRPGRAGRRDADAGRSMASRASSTCPPRGR